MKRGKSTRKPTKAEQERLDKIHAMPCICCELRGVTQTSKTEAHHLVDAGYRKHSGGHMASLPLCAWHHRAEPPTGFYGDAYRKTWMLEKFGPSLKYQGGKGKFAEVFGAERELLELVNKRLGEM